MFLLYVSLHAACRGAKLHKLLKWLGFVPFFRRMPSRHLVTAAILAISIKTGDAARGDRPPIRAVKLQLAQHGRRLVGRRKLRFLHRFHDIAGQVVGRSKVAAEKPYFAGHRAIHNDFAIARYQLTAYG